MSWKSLVNGEVVGAPAISEQNRLRAVADPDKLRSEAAKLRASRDSAKRALIAAYESRELSATSEARLRETVRTSARNTRTFS